MTQQAPENSTAAPQLTVTVNPGGQVSRAYVDLASKLYRERLGLSLGLEAAALAEASALYVCLDRKQVAGGLQLHVAGPGQKAGLPCERDGIDLGRYGGRFGPADGLRAEVNRNVTNPSYRAAAVQSLLLLQLAADLRPQGLKVLYWLANTEQTKNSHRLLRRLGADPVSLDEVSMVRGGIPEPRRLILSAADIGSWRCPHGVSLPDQSRFRLSPSP